MAFVKLAWLAAACRECACHKQSAFSIRRVRSQFDWIPEHRRFAFARSEADN